MGVAATVHELAKAVRTTIRPLQPHQALLVKLLELMPDFDATGRLDTWEQACTAALPPGSSADATDELLRAILGLGQAHLHDISNYKNTEDKYRHAVHHLRQSSIPVPKLQIGGLDEW